MKFDLSVQIHVASLSSFLMLQVYGVMDSREGETSYQHNEAELQAQEKKDANQKEVIDANAEDKSTPISPLCTE